MAKAKKAVAKINQGDLPAHLQDYSGAGQEDIDKDDILMPRLKLGQSMTPEVKDKLFDEGDLFHNITKEVVCKAGDSLKVIVVAYHKEYILWGDRKGPKDGQMLARARKVLDKGVPRYKWNRPNEEFEDQVEGIVPVKYKTAEFVDQDGLGDWGSQIPGDPKSGIAATAHYNYIVMLPEHDNEMIALSLSRSADRKAREFNTVRHKGKYPIFARVYKLSTFIDTADENRFANYQFGTEYDRIGEDPADEEGMKFFQELASLYESLQDKGINMDLTEDPTSGNKDDGKF